jgi:hypothetical protein
MEKTCSFLEKIKAKSSTEEKELMTFICDNTEGILDPLDQITYSMNEVQVTYGPVIVLKDAP